MNRFLHIPARLTVLTLAAACLIRPGLSLGQDQVGQAQQEEEPRKRPPTLFERNAKLVRDLQSLGPWQEQAKLIHDANRNVFEHYGWDSEPDRFARQLVGDVAQIPPWDFTARFNLTFTRVSERYELSEDQVSQIKPKVLWHGMRLMGKHVTTLFDLSEEILAARVEKRPFTPEEVARWSQLSEPLLLDGRSQLETLVREIEPLLSTKQREILKRDRDAEMRRIDSVLERMGDWQQGRWSPQEWGLQDDPFHIEGASRAELGGSAELVGADFQASVQYDASDMDAWECYVRDFIRRYGLDGDQSTTARAILADLRSRAGAHRAAMEKEAASSSIEDRMVRVYERLFEELQRRLDRIPTGEQRRLAEGTPDASGSS